MLATMVKSFMNAPQLHQHLQALGNEETARRLQRFFKTGPGEYGEGDVFLGIRVPVLRRLAREYQNLPLAEVTTLLCSPFHEARLLALFILVSAYRRGDALQQEQIYGLYLQHTRCINHWDLVDASAEPIVGRHLRQASREPLYTLARSELLWERRMAILATFHYIKQNEFAETLHIAELLLYDPAELIQKAVGWMLREVGKRDQVTEEAFLRRHCKTMPRTMLRYAIERFPEPLRQQYLRGSV
jgi:3-methyladenine DNA glycosylase AlkD